MKKFKIFKSHNDKVEQLPNVDIDSVDELIDHIKDFHETELWEEFGIGTDAHIKVEVPYLSKPNSFTTTLQVLTTVLDIENEVGESGSFHYTIIKVN